MRLREYNKVYNFAGYQCLWFAAILGGAMVEPLLFGLVALHLYMCRDRLAEAKVIALGAALGIAVDSVLTAGGVFVFNEPTSAIVPLWLMCIWFGFMATLRHSLSYLLGRPVLATLLACVGAPMTYLGGERLGAVSFGFTQWQTAVIIGVAWGLMMPILLFICRKAPDLKLMRRPRFFHPLTP